MKLKNIFIILIVLAAGLAGWGFLVEPNRAVIERVLIKDAAPDFLKGIKFLQISDLHFKRIGRPENKVLQTVKAESPDFIFITGDIVDWTTRDFLSLDKFFKELSQSSQAKIFAVFGNHDHRNNNFKQLKKILQENSVTVLNNQSELVNVAGGSFYLVGVDDPHLGYDNLTLALAKTDNFFKILLAHTPEIFRQAKGKVDLVLAGHTHGCQVDLPGLCDLVVPLKYDKKYKKGLFEENSTYLYINRGLGTNYLPFRLNASPEITLINFE
jgi:uncharacterized protein